MSGLGVRLPNGKEVVLQRSPILVGSGERSNWRVRIPEMEEKNTLLVRIDGNWMAFDLHTERRIICNGLAMDSVVLLPGQRVKFGGVTLEISEADASDAAERAALSTLIDESTSSSGSGRIQVSGGCMGSYKVAKDLLIGSDPLCDVSLPAAAGVSRKHAFLVWNFGDPWLVDLNSTNGVRAGGKKGKAFRLGDTPEFNVGKVACRWEMKRAALRDSSSSSTSPGSTDEEPFADGDPADADAWTPALDAPRQNLGTILAEAGDHAEAVAWFLQACRRDALDTAPRHALRASARQVARKAGVWRRATNRLVGWWRALLVRAIREGGDFERALELGEAVLAKDPACVPVHWEMARAFAALERARGVPPLATLWQLMHLRELTEESMADPDLNALIGNLLVDLGQFHRVAGVLSPAFRVNPHDSRLRAVEERASVERIVAQRATIGQHA